MKWDKKKLKDICTKIGSGATPKGGNLIYTENGTTFIRSQNVYNLSFSYEGLVYINDDASKKLDNVEVKKDDILLNITGDSVARVCKVPKNVLPARVNQHVAIIRCKNNVLESGFLAYYLASPYMQLYMLNLAVGKGASRNALTKAIIEEFEIPVPSIDIQRKIISILSAYDDLIENNQKQIKLLEEAAQRLYKEWFIDLRFPGYEEVEIVDGLPMGWEKVSIKEIAEFKRGKTITKDIIRDGNVPVIAGGMQPAYYHNVANTVAPVITVSASGANAGYTALHNIDVWASDCSFVDGNSGNIFYLFCFLKNNLETMQNLQRGSAQPHVYAKDINELKILRPSKKTLERFDSFANTYFSAIAVNERIIKDLKEARDRLLPKLMSGEVEV